jgi:hypothetical protein
MKIQITINEGKRQYSLEIAICETLHVSTVVMGIDE